MSRDDLQHTAIGTITAAFPVDPIPTAEEVQNDHCPECAELAARFSGKRWNEIARSDLEGNPSPSLLTATAFRYYLPAMMLHAIKNAAMLDCFPASLVGVLSPPGGKPSAHMGHTFAGITATQAAAIVAFLRYFEVRQAEDEPADRVGRRVVVRALNYWNQVAGTAA